MNRNLKYQQADKNYHHQHKLAKLRILAADNELSNKIHKAEIKKK